MATKQELIKWLTETRESLPFESKVQLIKNFWDNKESIEDLETKAKSLLNEELDLEKFKEQVLILKDLFTKADLPNTFALLLESWEELVKINRIFDNLGPDNTDSRPPSRSSFFNDDSDEETNNSESDGESDDDSDNDSESGETKQQEEEKWADISPNFTEKLVQEWKNNGFSYETAKEWVDIGMNPNKDANYCAWLRSIKKLTPEQVLNYGDGTELWNQYQEFETERQKNIEEYKTQILTILDGWKDNSNGEEKQALKEIIKVLANENLSSEQQFTELQTFLSKFPSNNVKLNNLMSACLKYLF